MKQVKSVIQRSINYKITLYCLILTLLPLISFCQALHNAELYDVFKQGEYDVGYQVINATDYSRSFEGSQGRDIKIMVWFPSKRNKDNSLSIQNYIRESKTDSTSWASYFNQVSSAINHEKLLHSSVLANESSQILDNSSIPLIVYSPGGYGDEFENFILCELLASHGYIVAAHESKGPNSSDTKITAIGLMSQARDIEFTIQKIRGTFSHADINNIGLMGWSWGGLASTLVQMRNLNINTVVSLDGSVSLHEDKLKANPYYSLQNINVPYLFISASKTSSELNNFISGLKYSESLFVEYPFLEHGDFNSLVYSTYFFTDDQSEKMTKVINSYRHLTSTVIEFINSTLKRGKEIRLNELLESPKNEKLIEYRTIESLPKPPTTDEFFKLFKIKSIEEIQNVFDETYRSDSAYVFFQPEEAINFAYALHYDFDRPLEAIHLLKMSLILFPDYYPTYGHLGNLYSKNGNLPEALENFSKAEAMVKMHTLSSADKQNLGWYNRSIERIKNKLKE